ncbi:hypothetical protein L596_027666 [Steinernema carpocapsae]|uniref:Uncharacterized protein n=1 Tax=Steinernema carpocapsae TaxID=34508 RepID=A0A4U5LW57_STECR|nr:hypothetical protein L596_027666 [Steinernema carpocapsae]
MLQSTIRDTFFPKHCINVPDHPIINAHSPPTIQIPNPKEPTTDRRPRILNRTPVRLSSPSASLEDQLYNSSRNTFCVVARTQPRLLTDHKQAVNL